MHRKDLHRMIMGNNEIHQNVHMCIYIAVLVVSITPLLVVCSGKTAKRQKISHATARDHTITGSNAIENNPLLASIDNGDVGRVNSLLENNFSLKESAGQPHFNFIFNKALRLENTAIAELLLRKRKMLIQTAPKSHYPLMADSFFPIVRSGKSAILATLFLENRSVADINLLDGSGLSLLHAAVVGENSSSKKKVVANKIEIMKLLIEQGIDYNMQRGRNEQGKTALRYAVELYSSRRHAVPKILRSYPGECHKKVMTALKEVTPLPPVITILIADQLFPNVQ